MTRRAPRRLPVGGALLLLLAFVLGSIGPSAVGLGARPALADPPEEPWARAIRDGIVSQDRELARTSPDAVVRRLSSRAGRQGDVVSLYLLGRAYGKQGDAASAFASYAEVLATEPRCWFAWRDRGVLRALKGDVAGAEADLKQAASLRPGYVDALEPLGMMLLEAKRYDEAIRYLQAVLDASPGLDRARLKIVEAHLAANRPDEALKTLEFLLGRTPNDPSLRHLRGRILVEKRDYAGAMRVFKQLATENPDAVLPLRAWLDAAARAAKDGVADVEPEEGIWVLERLRRVARTPEEKRKIGEQIEGLRRAAAGKGAPSAPVPSGPPTPEALARALRAPDAEARVAALHYVIRSPKEVPDVRGDLLVALVERLDPAREPAPSARILALAVLERYASPDFAVLLRGSLRDPDATVRSKAADVLGSLGNPLAVAALMRHATGKDLELATSARYAIYELAKVTPPLAEEEPAAQAAAFQTWFASARAQELKLAAMDAVLASADRAPDELLFPFALDEDVAVWSASWRALSRLVPLAKGASPRDVWMRGLPIFDADGLTGARREAFLDAMTTWWLKRPTP